MIAMVLDIQMAIMMLNKYAKFEAIALAVREIRKFQMELMFKVENGQ